MDMDHSTLLYKLGKHIATKYHCHKAKIYSSEFEIGLVIVITSQIYYSPKQSVFHVYAS